MCDIPWAPTIHIGVDTPVNPSMDAWVMLILHCTSKQARGSHPYWPHNTQRMDEHGGKKTGTLLASALDCVWCTMQFNHPYRCWHPSQFTNGGMGEVDSIPLYKQPRKGVTSILPTQHTNDRPCMDWWKLAHFLLLPWGVCDRPWAWTIYIDVDTPVNPYVGAWVRLVYHCIKNQAMGSHSYWPHNTQMMM